jgi:hypothetical protein
LHETAAKGNLASGGFAGDVPAVFQLIYTGLACGRVHGLLSVQWGLPVSAWIGRVDVRAKESTYGSS